MKKTHPEKHRATSGEILRERIPKLPITSKKETYLQGIPLE